MLRDNPNIKAIFVLRPPISRLISHYKFGYSILVTKGFTTIDLAVMHAFDVADKSRHTFGN